MAIAGTGTTIEACSEGTAFHRMGKDVAKLGFTEAAHDG